MITEIHMDSVASYKNRTSLVTDKKINLIYGLNGTGKSTLLRILSGILQASLGKVVTERDLRIGYLEQDPQFSNQETISDFIYSIGNERQQLIRQYEEAVNQEVHDEKVLNRLMDELSNEGMNHIFFNVILIRRLGRFKIRTSLIVI